MSDRAISDLEHALREAPGDGALRIKLSSELARSGRRGEALDVLDFAKVPFEHFGAAKELSERLWREEVASFVPLYDFERETYNFEHPKVDRTCRLAVAWRRGHIQVLDLAASEPFLEVPSSGTMRFARGGIVFFAVPESPGFQSVRVMPDGRLERSEHTDFPAMLAGVSRRADKVLGLTNEHFTVRAFPSLEVLAEGPARSNLAKVLWGSNRVLFLTARDPIQTVLGDEIIATFHRDSVELVHPALGWSCSIDFPTPHDVMLLGDRRTLRIMNRTDLEVHDLDPRTGATKVLSPRVWRGNNGWHPHSRIAMIGAGSSEYGRFVQDDERTTTILELQNGYSLVRWEADGRGFLARNPRGAIELHSSRLA